MAETTNTSKRKLYILTMCATCLSLASSLLNIEELQSVKYGLEILNKPVLLKESPDLDDTVLISSKYGQQYQCELPVFVVTEGQTEERKSFTTEEIAALLEPLRNSKCLYYNKGWWTYEFCFGNKIQQYHEEGGQIIGEKTLLGVYESQTEWDQEKIEETTSQHKKANVKRYHSHKYVNGSKCEVTGKPRETLVKFFCEKSDQDYVLRVDEPASCSYIITVNTDKLCKHPLFEPPVSQKPKQITCSPALPQEHYNKYLEKEEMKKKTAEAKKMSQAKAMFEKLKTNPDSEMSGLDKKRKKRVKSLLWPWEDAIEADDMMFIEGNLNKDKIGVSRMDFMQDRKHEGDKIGTSVITMRSETATRESFSPPSSEAKSSKKSYEQVLTEKQRKDVVPDSNSEGKSPKGDENKLVHAEKVAAKASDESKKSDEDKGEEKRILDGTDKDSFSKAYEQMRNMVQKELRNLGVDPDEMEKTFIEKLGGKIDLKEGDDPLEDFGDKILKELREKVTKTDDEPAVDDKLGKLSEMDNMGKNGKLDDGKMEKHVLASMRRLLREMDSHNALLMKKEKVLQSTIQKQFDEVRKQTNGDEATAREIVGETEDYKKQTEVENAGVKEAVGKIKEAMQRNEDINSEGKSFKKSYEQVLTDKQRKDFVPESNSEGKSRNVDENKSSEKSDVDKGEKKRILDDTHKDLFSKTYSQTKNMLWKELRSFGVDPDEMEKKFKAKLVGNTDLKEGNDLFERFDDRKLEEVHKQVTEAVDEHVLGFKTTVDEKLEKLSEMVNKMKKNEKLESRGHERQVFSRMGHVLKELNSHNALLMKKEKVLQSTLQKQFDKVRKQTNSDVATARELLAEIEDYEKQTGIKNAGMKETVGKIKEAMKRFENTNRELDTEMAAVQQLNDEIQNKVLGKMSTNFMKDNAKLGKEFFLLAAKANLLLGRLLRRSAKLDQEMRNIKNIGEEIPERLATLMKEKKHSVDHMSDDSTSHKSKHEFKIDKVIVKLKTLIKNLDKSPEYPNAMEKDLRKLKDTTKTKINSRDGQEQKEGNQDDKNIEHKSVTETQLGLDSLDKQQRKEGSEIDKNVKNKPNIDGQSYTSRQSISDSQSDMDSQLEMDSQSDVDTQSDIDSHSDVDSHSNIDSHSGVDSQSDMDTMSDMDSHLETNADGDNNEDVDSMEKYGSSSSDDVMDDVTDDRIKVRVRHIRSVDEKELAEEDIGDTEGGAEGDIEEMGTESRIKRATRKMERMVQEHLKDAGIIPKGKVRVKIITNRDAIRQFGGRGKSVQILSEQETNQFKDMIMNLLGGSQEAGRERKRQMELENNYNLVWNKERGLTSVQEKNDDQDDLDNHFVDDEDNY